MIFKKKSQIVLVTETFIDGQFVEKTVKVIEVNPYWVNKIVLGVAVLIGFWAMVVQGVFR